MQIDHTSNIIFLPNLQNLRDTGVSITEANITVSYSASIIGIRLAERPSSSLGATVSVVSQTDPTNRIYTKVDSIPTGYGEFYIDYDGCFLFLKTLASGVASDVITISYTGLGGVPVAEDVKLAYLSGKLNYTYPFNINKSDTIGYLYSELDKMVPYTSAIKVGVSNIFFNLSKAPSTSNLKLKLSPCTTGYVVDSSYTPVTLTIPTGNRYYKIEATSNQRYLTYLSSSYPVLKIEDVSDSLSGAMGISMHLGLVEDYL